MQNIEKEIISVDVLDVAVIGIYPLDWPRIHEHERVASVDELRLSLDDDWAVDDKRVLPAEIRTELLVGNVGALSGGARVLGPRAGTLRLFTRRPCLLFRPLFVGWFRLLFPLLLSRLYHLRRNRKSQDSPEMVFVPISRVAS